MVPSPMQPICIVQKTFTNTYFQVVPLWKKHVYSDFPVVMFKAKRVLKIHA